MSKTTYKTYDLNVRWNVVEINYNEQNPGGKYGKRRIINHTPLRREKALKLLEHCEEHHIHMVMIGDKNHLKYQLEEAI